MRTTIEVASRAEGDAIRRALADPEAKALVLVLGALLELPTDRARQRTLAFVADALDEEHDDQTEPADGEA